MHLVIGTSSELIFPIPSMHAATVSGRHSTIMTDLPALALNVIFFFFYLSFASSVIRPLIFIQSLSSCLSIPPTDHVILPSITFLSSFIMVPDGCKLMALISFLSSLSLPPSYIPPFIYQSRQHLCRQHTQTFCRFNPHSFFSSSFTFKSSLFFFLYVSTNHFLPQLPSTHPSAHPPSPSLLHPILFSSLTPASAQRSIQLMAVRIPSFPRHAAHSHIIFAGGL